MLSCIYANQEEALLPASSTTTTADKTISFSTFIKMRIYVYVNTFRTYGIKLKWKGSKCPPSLDATMPFDML